MNEQVLSLFLIEATLLKDLVAAEWIVKSACKMNGSTKRKLNEKVLSGCNCHNCTQPHPSGPLPSNAGHLSGVLKLPFNLPSAAVETLHTGMCSVKR